MGIMTACTDKFPISTQWIFAAGYGVPFHRMVVFVGNAGMAACTKFINGLIELEPMFSGMGTVTGNAANSL